MNPTGNLPVIWDPPRVVGHWEITVEYEPVNVPHRAFKLAVRPNPTAGAGGYVWTDRSQDRQRKER